MDVFHSPSDLKTKFSGPYFKGKNIGLIPTMGALHDGHISLVSHSKAENQLTAVSIFVNPTQFGPNEDFSSYPRTIEADLAVLEKNGVDIAFLPEINQMYPLGKEEEIFLSVGKMDKILCGKSRPNHFNGVLQIVNKLLNIIRPDRAYFGLKDFQQFTLIRRMAKEFFLPVEIIGCPIIRETDGLALSSRNRYLSESERKEALFLHKSLVMAYEMVAAGEKSIEVIKSSVTKLKDKFPLIRLDYFEILNEKNLSPVDSVPASLGIRAFVAAWCGKTRLIDNISLLREALS